MTILTTYRHASSGVDDALTWSPSQNYRFKPEQVDIVFIPSEQDPDYGQIEMTATGPWVETILWEIPLMSLLSETYFLVVDTAWKKENQEGMSTREKEATA